MGARNNHTRNCKYMPSNELNIMPYLESIAQEVRDSIRRQGLNATGKALGSIQVRNKRNVIAVGYIATLFQGVGRKPGRKPPINDLEVWVKAKGIQFARPSGLPMTTRQMAFAVANTIEQKGTRIFRDGRRGIQMKQIIKKNNEHYMPQIARELKNTYVEAFNLNIIT